MEKNTENYYEKFNIQLSIAVLLPYLVLTFQTFASQYIALNRIQIVSKASLGVYFLFVFAKYLYKLGGKLFLTILFFGLIFLIDAIFHFNVSTRFGICFYFLTSCLPILICASSITDWDIFFECSKKFSYITIVLGFLILLTRSNYAEAYNISLGYYLLFPTISMLFFVIKKDRVFISALFFALGLITITLMGSRGPLISIIVFVVFQIFPSFRKGSNKENLLKTGVIALIIYGFANFNSIIQAIYRFSLSHGMESRTLQYLIQGDFGNLSNRDIIYNWALEQINNSYAFGHGIGYSIMSRGTHCHNILLEMAVEFGVILTFIVFTALIIVFLYKLHGSSEKERNTILIWFCVGVIPLFMSSIYWEYMQFWCFIGVLMTTGNRIFLMRSFREQKDAQIEIDDLLDKE